MSSAGRLKLKCSIFHFFRANVDIRDDLPTGNGAQGTHCCPCQQEAALTKRINVGVVDVGISAVVPYDLDVTKESGAFRERNSWVLFGMFNQNRW